MKRSVASTLLAAVVACGDDSQNADSATEPGGDPPTGLYALTIVTTADTCTPSRAKGYLGTMRLVAGDGVNIPIPSGEGSSPTRQDVPWSGTSLVDVAGCSGSTMDIAIKHKSKDALALDITEDWKGLSACAGQPSASVFALPSTECTATRRFEFSLVKACPASDAPCR
jgi:hypothetical protein